MNNATSQSNRRPPVLASYSNRTISHPTFMPIYQESLQRWLSPARPPVPVMTPLDFYYTDPNLPPGHRVPNIVTKFEAIENFQLNTPPPIMSSQLAPPIQADPFLSGNHPVRSLGTRSWTIDHCNRPHPCTPRPQTAGTLEVIEMSQAEDDAITSLLLLHHSSAAKTPQGKGKKSPSSGHGLAAQSQQSLVQSPSGDVLSQSHGAILAKLESTPEASSSEGITTTATEPCFKELCVTSQVSPPPETLVYHPEIATEALADLENQQGVSLVAKVSSDVKPPGPNDPDTVNVVPVDDIRELPVDTVLEHPDLGVGGNAPLRPRAETESRGCNGHQSERA